MLNFTKTYKRNYYKIMGQFKTVDIIRSSIKDYEDQKMDFENQEKINRKLEAYKDLLYFLDFEDYAKTAIDELRQIIVHHKNLDNNELHDWIDKYWQLFEEDPNIFLFGIDYLDDHNTNDPLNLPWINEKIDSSPFKNMINFWKSMWLLYWSYNARLDDQPRMSSNGYYSDNSFEDKDPEVLFMENWNALCDYLDIDLAPSKIKY